MEFQNTSVPDLVWQGGAGETGAGREAGRGERVGAACGEAADGRYWFSPHSHPGPCLLLMALPSHAADTDVLKNKGGCLLPWVT